MSNKTCADSIYEYTRAERPDYVACVRRSWLIAASVCTGVLFIIACIVGAVSLSNDAALPAAIAFGAFVVVSSVMWSLFGASESIANTFFDKHDRKVELALAASPGKPEAQVLVELRQAEIGQRNFEKVVNRTPGYGQPGYGQPGYDQPGYGAPNYRYRGPYYA